MIYWASSAPMKDFSLSECTDFMYRFAFGTIANSFWIAILKLFSVSPEFRVLHGIMYPRSCVASSTWKAHVLPSLSLGKPVMKSTEITKPSNSAFLYLFGSFRFDGCLVIPAIAQSSHISGSAGSCVFACSSACARLRLCTKALNFDSASFISAALAGAVTVDGSLYMSPSGGHSTTCAPLISPAPWLGVITIVCLAVVRSLLATSDRFAPDNTLAS